MREDLLKSLISSEDIMNSAERVIMPVVLSNAEREAMIDSHLAMTINPERNAYLVEAIKRASPFLSEHSEAQIRDLSEATETDQMLRVSFWSEIGRAIKDNKQLNESDVYANICNRVYWDKVKEPSNSLKMAYILTPVKEYEIMNKVLLAQGQQVLLDILNANPYIGEGKKKRLDPRIAKVQLEAYALVEARVYGKAVQRIQQHNINETSKESVTAANSIDLDALKADIKKLELTHMDLLESSNIPLDDFNE